MADVAGRPLGLRLHLGRARVDSVVLRPLAVLLWVPVAVIVQLLRSSRVPLWDVVWAEDGRFFTGEARLHPWSTTVFEPLASYLQLAPRILSALIAQLPVRDAAVAISVSAALTTALLSVYVFIASADVLEHLWQRCAVTVLVVLHPAASYEVNVALNNLHWYLLFAAFWASIATATSKRRLVIDTAVVAMATLSDPLAGLLLPILIVRAVRSRRRWWPAAALAVCLAIQYVTAISHTPPAHGSRHLADLPLVYVVRVAANAVLGDALSRREFDAGRTPLLVVVAVLLAAVLALAVRRARGGQRILLLTLIGYSVGFLVVTLAVRGGAAGFLHRPAHLPGSRYVIVPLWMLYSAFVVAAGLPPREGRRWAFLDRFPDAARSGLLPAAVLVLIGLQLIGNYTGDGARTSGTSWHRAVEAAALACSSGKLNVRVRTGMATMAEPFLLRPGLAAVPVAPFGRSFWAVRVRCSDLGAG